MFKWRLRFNPDRTRELMDRYPDEDQAIVMIGQRARQAGRYRLEDFLAVCKWKTPRSQPRCQRNTADEVSEVTRVALATPAERLRIGALRCLAGVDWPTASVLLHLAHRDPYPILDVRALWSWGFDESPSYSFELWWQYVEHCRALARRQDVDMRTLDRALWQYSKEHQGRLT